MFVIKFLGLTLSAMLTVFPVNKYTTIKYPFTRTDRVFYRVTYDIDDLGDQTPLGLVSQHCYNIVFTVHVTCSSSCSYGVLPDKVYGHNINDNTLEIFFVSRQINITPNDLVTWLNDTTTNGTLTKDSTYSSSQTQGTINIPLALGSYSTSVNIYFPAETNQMILGDIAANLDELSDWYFVKNFLMDTDVPSSNIQTVKNYIDNGDYSSAVQYIENYYITNSVTENQNNETVVNNYTTKQTDLNTYFTTENNFTNQVETDFTNQNQNIPLQQTTLEFTNSNFTKSAEWVTLRFNDLFNSSPYGKLLSFSLITGFILALIGRFKR